MGDVPENVNISVGNDDPPDPKVEQLEGHIQDVKEKITEAKESGDSSRLTVLEKRLSGLESMLGRVDERTGLEDRFAPREHSHDDRYLTREEWERARLEELSKDELHIPEEPITPPPPVEEEHEEIAKVRFGW